MNKTIIALVDYKGKFGSKHFDSPYRSGMDKELLKRVFNDHGIQIEFIHFHKVDLRDVEKYRGANIIYTSSEDIGYHYKSYIEDVVLGLEELGSNLLPKYRFLRANNNKVFMEFLRTTILKDNSFYSKHFGSLKDLLLAIDTIEFPIVLKNAEGASGTGVYLANSKREIVKYVKKMKDYSQIKEDFKDFLRPFKHKGYIKESIFRNKFIVQPFVPNLKNDWKVYFFGEKLYVFNRPIQKGRGITASGGGYDNYLYGLDANAPNGMFDFCQEIFNKLDIPQASIDIAFDGTKFYLIEFQALYFGTAGIPYSKGHFRKEGEDWNFFNDSFEIEKVYVDSIIWYLNK